MRPRYDLHHGRYRSRWPDPGRLLDGLLRGHRRGAVAGQDVLRQAEADFQRVDSRGPQVSGFTREETLQFDDPQAVMQQFADWIIP